MIARAGERARIPRWPVGIGLVVAGSHSAGVILAWSRHASATICLYKRMVGSTFPLADSQSARVPLNGCVSWIAAMSGVRWRAYANGL